MPITDPTADAPLPAPLVAVRRRFEEWRSCHSPPCRIPPPLWKAAVRCAGKYGILRTTRALRLEYNGLKRRVAASAGAPADHGGPPAFVELARPGGDGAACCIVEVERPGGARLRMEFRGPAVPDIADLVRRFVSEGA